VSWHAALEAFCREFKAVQARHGAESVAFLGTGQLPTEELALLGSVAKFGMGLVHGDGNTRQCMATAATAYKQSFGYDAPPYSYQDFEESDVIVLVGGNLCVAHPILWERVCRNRCQPHIVVIDPRRTETAMQATTHLPVRPKGDLALLYSVAHVLVREGWIDREFLDAHTNGFAEFASHVEAYSPASVAERTGIPPNEIERLARTIQEGSRVSFWWTMGVNQSYEGVRTAQALINLALMTGNIGRPGTGANSITGQCNAMGSRLFSNTSCLLGARDFANLEHRRQTADVLGILVEHIPDRAGWPYHRILEGIAEGAIRGLWIVCTNTAHSWIHQDETRELLEKLEFLVVQDMYATTETAQLADLVLPAAGWGEKEGTFINSERRIGVIKNVAPAPGEALSDFSILRLIAEYWGCGEMFRRWTSPEAVFEILKELSRDMPCDFTGAGDYAAIDCCGGVQWPCREPAESLAAERRLFADGRFYHADGRAKFLFEAPRDMPEPPDADYPLQLLTGRGSASQWHTQTRTGKSPVLQKLAPRDLHIEIHPHDAQAAGVVHGQRVVVKSRRGAAEATAVVTPTVARGQAFMPMHFAGTNRLTLPHFDPYSHQPSYKDCAVRVVPKEFANKRIV
jgi:assimilatory nitrate reductase catalytic subunit